MRRPLCLVCLLALAPSLALAAPERLRLDFADPAALAALDGRDSLEGKEVTAADQPEPGLSIDFRRSSTWRLTTAPATLRPSATYRLAVRLTAVAQPLQMRFEVVAADDTVLGRINTRETKGKPRDLELLFPSPPQPVDARVRLESYGGGGTVVLHELVLEPLPEPVSPYRTGYGLLPPTLSQVSSRMGLVIEAEDAAPAAAVAAEDVDGDGRWAALTLTAETNPTYFSNHTVLKSDHQGEPQPLELVGENVLPGRYRLFISDPGRPATVTVAGREPVVVAGGKGEAELGVVDVADTLKVRVERAASADDSGPIYVDYLRLLPLYDPNRPLPAPQPRARVEAPGSVTLTAREPGAAARRQQWVVGGLPLPPGALRIDGPERAFVGGQPALVAPLATWPGGAGVKWLQVAAPLDIAAGASVPQQLLLDRLGDARVAPWRAVPQPAADSGLAALLPGDWPTPQLTVDAGEGASTVPLDGGEVTVLEQSPWRVVRDWRRMVEVDGQPTLIVEAQSEIRAPVGDQPAAVGLRFALVNASGRALQLRRAALVLPAEPAEGTPTRLRAIGSGEDVASFEGHLAQETPAAAGWRETGRREDGDGWLSMEAGAGTLAVGIRDMLHRYPNALIADPAAGALTVELWPAEAAPLKFDRGARMAHRLAVLAEPRSLGDAEVREALAEHLHPVRLLPPAEWVRASGVLGKLTPVGEPRGQVFDQLIADSLERVMAQRSAYGVEDFGGVFDPGGYVPGSTRLWSNMEYDFVRNVLTHWARSGEPAVFERADQAARHFMDNDLLAWDPNPARIGGSWVHTHSLTISHHAGWPNFGHAGWPQGPLWQYYLTGEPSLLQGSRGLADYVVNNIPTPAQLETQLPRYSFREERDAGNALLTLATVYEATGEQRYLEAARQVFDFVLRTQEPDGNWGTPITEQPPYRGTTMMIATLYAGLEAYRDVSGDPRVDDVLRRHIPWLLTQARDERGRYPFKHAPLYGASDRNLHWYAPAYWLCAEVADEPTRRRLLANARDDFARLYTQSERTCMFQTDVGTDAETTAYAAGGKPGPMHDYELEVRGRRFAYRVNGATALEGEFSGRPMTTLRFWSGMRAQGTVPVERVRVEGSAAADGARAALLDHDFASLAPFQPQTRSAAARVVAEDGHLKLIDPDGELVSARWEAPEPLASYRVAWRQAMPEGMYGGLYLHADGAEILHVGLGQGTSAGPPFTSARSFAAAVANLSRLLAVIGD